MARENLAEEGNVVGGDGVAPLLVLLAAGQEPEGGEAKADHRPVQQSVIKGVVLTTLPPVQNRNEKIQESQPELLKETLWLTP